MKYHFLYYLNERVKKTDNYRNTRNFVSGLFAGNAVTGFHINEYHSENLNKISKVGVI